MARVFIGVVAGLVVALALTIQARHEAGPPDLWDREAAAQYLDERMDVWWQRAKPLKTGPGDVRCLSCHTALPYVLARPLLRRAMGVTAATVHETRILETARQRARYSPTDQLYYDHAEDKKLESRGVEAVINAFVLTANDHEHESAPSPETTAAMARLWAVQREDGAWDWLNFGLEPFEAPDAIFHGATLAAFAAGSAPGQRASADAKAQAGITRLKGYLRAQQASQRLFNRAWVVLAAARLDGVLSLDERVAVIRELSSRQRPDGGWSLNDLGPWRWERKDAPFGPPGTTEAPLLAQSDGYATGLVVYALRQSGIDDSAVKRGQEWLRAHQVPIRPNDLAWAPWRAYSLNHDRENGGARGEPWRRMFMSDLATAFAVLALL
jgi:squalene-hopene/tetraprenyl-beta-curcumene cyclase